jgi:hypothetical protein
MPFGPPVCSFNRECEDDFGSSLKSDGKKFWHGKYHDSTAKSFLLAENFLGRQKVYYVMHYLHHYQTSH